MTKRRPIVPVSVAQAAALLVVGMLIGLALDSQAQPAAAQNVQRFSLLAATMQPVESSIEYDTEDGFLRTVLGTAGYGGQVDLPDGAQVVGLRGFGLDTDPNSQFCCGLMRFTLYNDPVGELITDLVCSGESFQGGEVVLDAPVHSGMTSVDNEQYSYAILLVLPEPGDPPLQDLAVLRFVVESTYQVQLPLVPRGQGAP